MTKPVAIPGFAPPEDVAALAKAKLASSGLDAADAKRLRITHHDADRSRLMIPEGYHVPSIRFAYHGLDGAPLLVRPRGPEFFRLRYLREPVPPPKRFRKYMQAPGSPVFPYLPPLVDWAAAAGNADQQLLITEGELKAAKATREGFPTIGLGGVYSFGAKKDGVSFLPLLEEFVWLDRSVVIAYDSDVTDNPDVCTAVNKLADELTKRGALPSYLFIPPVAGLDKTGLDDYLVRNSAPAFAQLLSSAVPLTLAAPLRVLNERYAYVTRLRRVIWLREASLMTGAELKELETDDYHDLVMRPSGDVSRVPVSAADAWLRWPLRCDVRRMTYRPGADALAVIEDDDVADAYAYNSWPGWGVAPRKGDTSAFVALFENLTTGLSDAERRWFLAWLAYPLRNPGVKLYTAALIYGVGQGTGKTLLGYTLGRIYGRNYVEIGQRNLHSDFNGWADEKQFVLGDEVTGSDKRADLDLLKKIITQKEVMVNRKHQPEYVIPDCVNYYLTSNRPNAIPLEDRDRRFFVHRAPDDPLPAAFFAGYDKLLWGSDDFSAAVFDYLLNVDLKGFDPRAAAPRTEAKREMTERARSDLGAWLRDVAESPDEALSIGGVRFPSDLATNGQLRSVYAARAGVDPAKVTARWMGLELEEAGFRKVLSGGKVGAGADRDRYYAVRNPKKWLKASPEDVRKHIERGPRVRS